MNCTTTVNLCPYSNYHQLAPQQDYRYISSEQFTPQTRWHPSCPPHMIAWIQQSMGLWKFTTSFHQRWTPNKYLKSSLSTATVLNVGYKVVHGLRTLKPAAHSADSICLRQNTNTPRKSAWHHDQMLITKLAVKMV